MNDLLNSIGVPGVVITLLLVGVALGPVGRTRRATLIGLAGNSDHALRLAEAACRRRYLPLISHHLTTERIESVLRREREEALLSSLERCTSQRPATPKSKPHIAVDNTK